MTALEDFTVIETIGRGSFGVVSKIKRKADGKVLVWKQLAYGTMSEKEKALVVSEVNILRELRSPHVVKYYSRILDKNSLTIFILMEFCEGGDLGRVIKRHKKAGTRIDEATVWKYFAQIVAGLKACHRRKEGEVTKPILHRDLKPQNILLDASQVVKIGDFGLAKELGSQSKFATTTIGTPYYMSPECITESKYNEKSDIWALGCLVYELCALAPPFEAHSQASLSIKIREGRFSRIPAPYSDDLHRTIRWMLAVDCNKRPTVDELERVPQIRRYLAPTPVPPAIPVMPVAPPAIPSMGLAAGAPAPVAVAAAAAPPTIAASAPIASVPTAVAPAAPINIAAAQAPSFAAREADLIRRETDVSRREAELARREEEFRQRLAELARREADLAREQSSLRTREALVSARETVFSERRMNAAMPAMSVQPPAAVCGAPSVM